MNFNAEESQSSTKTGSCLACGNCLSGCPYNAKNSTDKNYLALAVQAGCTINTECEVQFLVRNCEEDSNEISRKQKRRWRVYTSDIDYVTADFVIISAGVFGTAKILFQSERRGLTVSDRLGYGFSCNGNNVAYLAASAAPLNGQGVNKEQFSKIPFQDRPGPSISSSYTSSLGFTIQSAVLPASFPSLLFKGVTTYGWPVGYWFLHGLLDKMKHMMRVKDSQAMVLNVMGHDESDGRTTLEENTNNISFCPPHDPLLNRKIQALQKLTKRLGGILFMSRYRSTSVHLLGGCNASTDPSQGVCNSNGQVFNPASPSAVHPGLYVCDASLIPCSIGINPCLTIATASEHISQSLVQDVLRHKNSTHPPQLPSAETANQILKPELRARKTAVKSTVIIKETMTGYLGGMPCKAYLTMKMSSRNNMESREANSALEEPHQLLRGRVGGYVVFKAVEKDKLYIIDGEVDMCRIDNKTPYTQYMYYHLILASSSGSRYVLQGKKIMNPYFLALYGWKETTTLHVTLGEVKRNNSKVEMVDLKGELRLTFGNLIRSLISLKGNKKGRFVCLLLQSFWRTYILQTPRGNPICLLASSELEQKPYPPSDFHEIETDGCAISCRQWKCEQNQGKQRNPVLLINGYITDSFCLPTEPNDLVRTLVEEGYETWLLQARLHPLHPSNNFTIEDIGKFDIPAAVSKILELHGTSVKVHVVAHCAGGLAIHIALMGGYVSASHIASLCCTNSSMFFKLTISSLVKMRLPLIPISMTILGKNTILPFETSKSISLRHLLLKRIARIIPRCERCTLDECEVISGIFGNAFWHSNTSPTMHQWVNKQSLLKLPMSGFTHLRKICLSGFIVDSSGNNTYLIHPERMQLHTTYISGGKSLLVTPETSFLANNYMKLHQPGYKHTRVVVEDFGHSDLLIGENSSKFVFPHILSHIKSSENEEVGVQESKYRKEALSWSKDPYQERNCAFVSPLILFWFLILCLWIVIPFFI
ncbi:uncharacterized protein LOC113338294 isoform X1 [Papaver somniferum]|uniref:uncharacterized protein LOC113338294 isoform X1 n=1 Tax=Papaver somniferum TaxID=3469 RepID=UPI000E7030C5|nr:uncharacterized protein LOC113338294 isoform X1 [Papaver somniferum]